MSDKLYLITFTDGTTEEVYGEARVADGVLTITSHYGVTYGVKDRCSFPLTSLRSWVEVQR